VAFSYWRKWLERYVLDWEATQSLTWGMARGQLAAGPDNWSERLFWQHFREKPLKEIEQVQGDAQKLAAGLATLEEIQGPDWAEKMEQRYRELALSKQLAKQHDVKEIGEANDGPESPNDDPSQRDESGGTAT
jgi:hypothetical protein